MAVTVAYENLQALREQGKEEVGKVVVGQRDAVELLLVAAIARGHVLLEGPPGTKPQPPSPLCISRISGSISPSE